MKTKLLLSLALALGLALPGCKSPPPPPAESAQKFTMELRDAVTGTVTDPARVNQMVALIDQLDAAEVEFNQHVTTFIASFKQLNAGYDTPRAAFDDLFKTYDAQRIATRDRFLEVHFKLTALATKDEWKKIGKVEKKIYEELLKPRAQQEEDAS